MRISDWSSDVCSSYLVPGLANRCAGAFGLTCGEPLPEWKGTARATLEISDFTASLRYRYIGEVTDDRVTRGLLSASDLAVPVINPEHYLDLSLAWDLEQFTLFGGVINLTNNKQTLIGSSQERSEENTSELQSLMRISYAVFCLN